ncbi:SDR family oxidoreductase [Geodermatophilus sp. URMC 63]
MSTVAMGLEAAPMPVVGYLGAAMRADLGLTGAQLGLVVGVFYGATGVTSLLGSRVVDRLGARWWVAGDQALTAAGLAAVAAVGSLPALLVSSAVTTWEGQIGQLPYASAKAGIVGLTLVAARDLASKQIRVVTIAPGTFDTPILARLPENVRESLGQMVPHPRRLGVPDEFARLALAIADNPMLNGETIRLDGAIRMQPR